MKKELAVIFLSVMLLVQGCATFGAKKTASTPIAQGCEVFCESTKTLEDCEKESREFFGFECRAVHNPEWTKERFLMRDPGSNPTATEIMKSRMVQSMGAQPAQRQWIIRKK